MDLAFVISTTAVDQDKNFEKTKEIIKETVEKFGLHSVRYSLITFGATPDVKIRFDNVFDTEEELGTLVDNVKKAFGDAALDKALEEARYLFALAEDARPNAMKVLVVITDKRSDSSEEEVQIASEKLKNDGVRVIAIALGDESDTITPEVIEPGKDSGPEEVVKELVTIVLNGLFLATRLFQFSSLLPLIMNPPTSSNKRRKTLCSVPYEETVISFCPVICIPFLNLYYLQLLYYNNPFLG